LRFCILCGHLWSEEEGEKEEEEGNGVRDDFERLLTLSRVQCIFLGVAFIKSDKHFSQLVCVSYFISIL
jgi:hypothetical protein